MNTTFIDIETLEANQDKYPLIKEIQARRDHYKKAPRKFSSVLEETSLNGAFGRIFCIGIASTSGPTEILCDTEETMLKRFWQKVHKTKLFVGFNIFDFDLKFIWQRSIILGIKPTQNIKFIRGSNSPIYDIYHEWSGWSGGVGSRVSLDALAKVLNIPSPKSGNLDGSQVSKAFREGRFEEICEYCKSDVEATREIYKRMNFLK